ncbi:MAG: ABC transporter substrate-binding protein [Actinomycetota bacterium]
MRRPLVLILILALLGAACGGSDDTDSATGATEEDAVSESVSASASESDSASASDVADESSSASASDSASEPAETTTTTTTVPAFRTVEHAFGSTEVPGRPGRIAVLNSGTILPILLFLGVDTIVGAPLPDGPIEATRLLDDDDLVGIESIGFPQENPELLAAVQPDLIIGFDLGLQETYDAYSQIAPTVAIEQDLNDWRGTGERVAAALGLEQRMADGLVEYDARVAALREAIGDPAAIEVSVVRALGPNIRLHTPFHFAGQVIADVGFSWPEAVPTDDPETRLVQVSLEELPSADADHVFVFGAGQAVDGSDVDATVQAILDHPLYPTLGVAETGNLHVVDPLGWQQGGIPAANLILGDLEGVFAS